MTEKTPVDQEKPSEIDLLWNVSESLVSSRVLNDVLQLIVTATAEVMRTKVCSIMLLDKEAGELRLAATQALSEAYRSKGPVKVGESISGRALKERKPLTVANVSEDPSYAFPDVARQDKLVSMACVPMLSKGEVIGVINCYTKKPRDFTPAEIRTLQTVANQAAAAIENSRLAEENQAVKRALEDRKLMDQAKAILMEEQKLTEKEAYQLIHKTSRDSRKTMGEVAQSILLVYKMKK